MSFHGAMTALVTPMRDGRVDYDALAGLIEDQIAAGIAGLVAVGTTGESSTLDMNEHIDVIRFVIEAARKRVPVLAGAGANATAEALELTAASEKAGADGLLQVTPYYNKPTQEGLYRHFETLARATKLPVLLYNVPGRTSCDLLPATVERLARIGNIVGIKEATPSTVRATELLERCPRDFVVLSGDDFTTFPLYAVGAHGVVSVVSNVMPAQMVQMWQAVQSDNWARARELHFRIQPLTRLLFVEANPIGVKAALALLGKIDWELRPPLYTASDALIEQLRQQLTRDGLL